MKGTREDAQFILNTLESRGYKSYLAGGCVRDILLGLEPNDYDITTSATPEQVQELFNKTVPVGISFGVVKVVNEGRELDVATFCTDGQYSDNRRPDSVAFTSSAEEDVKRRDFTINALLMDSSGDIIDYVGGRNDLTAGILRTVGKPAERFGEDALRMMRAIRFATRFNLKIDPATWSAIKTCSQAIRSISSERVTDELTKTFSYGNCDQAYLLLRHSFLWRHWFNNAPDADDSWHSLCGLARVQPNDPLILPLLIILTGTLDGGRKQHLERLVLTNTQKTAFASLLKHSEEIQTFLSQSVASQRKMLQWEDLALVDRYMEYQSDNSRVKYDLRGGISLSQLWAKRTEIAAMGWPNPIITGQILIEMGYVAGPVFSEMLDEIRDSQLEGNLNTIADVTKYLATNFSCAARIENGVLVDRTLPTSLVAQCPRCSRSMSASVPRNARGKYLWDQANNKININYWNTVSFIRCQHCSGKRAKSSFTEVHL